MNVKNKVIHNALFQAGKLDNVAVSQRRIIEVALSKNASAIILVHNHPS